MKTHTYRRKLEEAEYFHSQILDHYDEDSDLCGYYLNAFIIACRSSLDFVVQDFLYSIKVYDMKTHEFTDDKKRAEKLLDNLEKYSIEKFASDYDLEMKKMREDPETNYFLNKRNTFMHQMQDGIKSYSYLEKIETAEKSLHARYLERSTDFEKHPELFKDLKKGEDAFRKTPYFKEQFTNSSEFECAIREIDMKPFLKSFLNKCKKFCEKFDEY